MKRESVALLLSLGVVACGPGGRDEYGGGGVDAAPQTGPEVCDDGFDNDQDGNPDCSDSECSGIGNCPVCEPPTTQALALPDGNDEDGGTCSTDASCSTNYCVAGFCASPYISQAIWSTFGEGATLANASQLQKVCLEIEHSWLADLQIELVTPNGVHLILHSYNRNNAPGIYLGDANDNDDASSGVSPQPGMGNEYCFTPTATKKLWQGTQVSAADNSGDKISPGEFASASPWAIINGAPLNGTWELRVTDLWGDDNGFLFSWSMEFDPSLAPGCGPVIIY
ncbi:MAG: proprotein convertase P-domain-containing protein [Kofleriaceae bacterium]|nr:proprotein convertase P-domain-containing protein [Kofleriaceae bacterium]